MPWRSCISRTRDTYARMRYTVLLALCLAVGCAHGKPAPTGPAHDDAPADVVAAARSAIESWRQAYEVRSSDALGKLYAHEVDAVVVLDGQALIGWSSIEAMLKDKLARA